MCCMRIQLLVSVLFALAVTAAWWLGRWAGGGRLAGSLPALSASPVKGARRTMPALPAPKMVAAANLTSQPLVTEPSTPLLRKILNGEFNVLTIAQLEGYLRKNGRSAESLVTASRLTHDLTLAREAASRFPNDPGAHLELVLRSDDPIEKQRSLEVLKTADPGNALGPYLAAEAAFAAGDADAAVRNLAEAAQRPVLTDRTLDSLRFAEEAYLAAGYQPLEAKAAAVFGARMAETDHLQALGRQMSSLMDSYAAGGDAGSAQATADMGAALGRQIQESMGHSVGGEMIGMDVESRFLKGMDPMAVLNGEGLTVQQRLEELAAKKDLIKSIMRGVDPTDSVLSPQVLAQYLALAQSQGEVQAQQWLLSRLRPPAR